MNLPKTYSEELWKRGGEVESHKQYIGKPYLSWSQVESWRDKKGFNMGNHPGWLEYMVKYFFGHKFPDMGWGQFGHEVEDYICEKKGAEFFTDEERETLDKISPLGVFQREVILDFGEFVLLGYIDDHSPVEDNVVSLMVDYKTKSENSKKDLHDGKKLQLDLYTEYLLRQGYDVKQVAYVIIERLGGGECMRGGGRGVLKVGKRIWHEEYTWSKETIQRALKIVEKTAQEISQCYEVFLSLNSDSNQ